MKLTIHRPLIAIRKKCLNCCASNSQEVKLCRSLDCPLWAWRFGRRPTPNIKNQIKNAQPYTSVPSGEVLHTLEDWKEEEK